MKGGGTLWGRLHGAMIKRVSHRLVPSRLPRDFNDTPLPLWFPPLWYLRCSLSLHHEEGPGILPFVARRRGRGSAVGIRTVRWLRLYGFDKLLQRLHVHIAKCLLLSMCAGHCLCDHYLGDFVVEGYVSSFFASSRVAGWTRCFGRSRKRRKFPFCKFRHNDRNIGHV